MEADWYVARYRLRQLRQQHPSWSQVRLAGELGYSVSWVKKWSQRLDEAAADDEQVLHSQSRARKRPPEPIAPEVVTQILTLRDDPPEGLRRTPGPVAIKYYLHRDEALKAQGHRLPTSTSTIWQILDQHQRIARPAKPDHTPLSRAGPLEAWQIDFKDVTTVASEPGGKRQHAVETLNIVDSGTSILVDNPARNDFNAETTIESLSETFQRWGLPQKISFDRDPRFVSSWRTDDFPSPLIRLLLCLAIEVEVQPPQRPDKNGYVERLNRTYEEEGIQIYLPVDLGQTQAMNRDFRYHFNYQRPNQARSCGNLPPRVAFADLPTLPPLPDVIDPDRWLEAVEGQLFKRRVDAAGTIRLDKHRYYIGRALKGRRVVVQIDAPNKQAQVLLDQAVIKSLPLKGLQHGLMPLSDYLALIQAEAISQWRHYLRTHPRYLPLAL